MKIVARVVRGHADPTRVTFRSGEPIAAFSLGPRGAWQVGRDPRSPTVVLRFDGTRVLLRPRSGREDVHVDGAVVADGWTELAPTCTLKVGGAEVRFAPSGGPDADVRFAASGGSDEADGGRRGRLAAAVRRVMGERRRWVAGGAIALALVAGTALVGRTRAAPVRSPSTLVAPASPPSVAPSASTRTADTPPQTSPRAPEPNEAKPRTLERKAADATASGAYRRAATLYDELARENPDRLVFAETKRIVERRVAGGR